MKETHETVVDTKRAIGARFDIASLPEKLQEQSGAWLRAQSAFMEATQTMMSAWRKCRQDDIGATLVTIQKVMGSKNGADVAAAYSEWLTGSMDRIKVELSEARDEAHRLATIGQQSLRALSPNEAGRIQASGPAVTNSTERRAPHASGFAA